MRVNAYLARAGVASRRGSDELIRAGRVTVNGETAELGTLVRQGDRVELDGRLLAPEPFAYILLHKPAGVVTTARDPQGRPTVVGLVGHALRLVPVGRLDADTTGALLLTNDGQLAHRLAHPRYGVDKVYVAEVLGIPDAAALGRLRDGIDLEDGRTAPASVRLLAQKGNEASVELVLHEGRKRQVRRRLEAVGHPVIALERVRFGPLWLGKLEEGQHRRLTAAEIEKLRRAGR